MTLNSAISAVTNPNIEIILTLRAGQDHFHTSVKMISLRRFGIVARFASPCGAHDTAPGRHRCYVFGLAGISYEKDAVFVTLSFLLTSSAASAQEEAGDAALGTLSGAVVLGPVGRCGWRPRGRYRRTLDCECLGFKAIELRPRHVAEPSVGDSSPAQRRQI